MKKIVLSIIIANYHVKNNLFSCIQSIIDSKPKVSFEIIVVDNDEEKTIEKELTKKFPKVRYIKNENKGFGQGNNIGSKYASGEYLFFLNPDTQVKKGTVDTLVDYLNNNKKVGIAAPMLYDSKEKIVPLQGARELTPLRAIFSFSFINKFFPNNPIAKNYWYKGEWDKTSVHAVDSIPGAAFVIRRKVYEKVNGFDEKFFLYFEEHDLCKRVKETGWEIVMHPKAQVLHTLGTSTKQIQAEKIKKIFKQSRFYYLKKHFGLMQAVAAEAVLRMNKYSIALAMAIIIGIGVRLMNIDATMSFIGDQAWFYLSARDMLLTGEIPLVGITSSHPWLHQGALWTYVLGIWFGIFGFNPLNGVLLSILFDTAAIFLLYKLGSMLFSQRVGLLASFLYAASPLVAANARMPYHTSPIPLVTILFFFCLFQWISGKKYYFPFLIVVLALLYNLELAAFLLAMITVVIGAFGLWYRKKWALAVFEPKILLFSVIGFILAMLPMLIYDVQNGFPQTLKFLAWVGYKGLSAVGFFPSEHLSLQPVIGFSIESYQELVYPFSGFLSFLIFLGSTVYILFRLRKKEKSVVILFVTSLLLILGFLAVRTPSTAYLPMMFPGLILIIVLFFDWLFENKYAKHFLIPIFVLVILFNCFYLFSKSYSKYEPFTYVKSAAEFMVKESAQKEYTIVVESAGGHFETFTMNYEYIAWWLGHGPSKEPQQLQFVVTEAHYGVTVKKEMRDER